MAAGSIHSAGVGMSEIQVRRMSIRRYTTGTPGTTIPAAGGGESGPHPRALTATEAGDLDVIDATLAHSAKKLRTLSRDDALARLRTRTGRGAVKE
ncbi:hypothetical protein MTBLM5_80076 [Magnetospirillum sp. LM-5]|nr:hypothetical protein MTBLM5_80076 [Magnetospirillum sp. LM-5]